MTTSIRELVYKISGYKICNEELFRTACTHRSIANEMRNGIQSYERQEFLGDRILGFIIAEWLYEKFRYESETNLAKRHSILVAEDTLVSCAKSISLDEHLIYFNVSSNSMVPKSKRIIADMMEALIGALYLDGGMQIAKIAIKYLWKDLIENQITAPTSPKTELQELMHKNNLGNPKFIVASKGPVHNATYTATLDCGGIVTTGVGKTIKDAETQAAERILVELKKKK